MKKTFYIITSGLLFIIIITIFTPYPASYMMRGLFHNGNSIDNVTYKEINEQIEAKFDLDYPSSYKSNQFDSFRPKNETGNLPLIIWVHGGAYVGGDKSDVAQYAILMAAEGYHVISMNYARAPGETYPAPILQLAEVYQYIEREADKMDIDLNQIFLAGDSAGAQMVAQFTNIQVNDKYAAKTGLPQIMQPEQIRGVFLFSGLYNLKKLNDLVDQEKFKSFLLDRIGWAYINDRNWRENEKTEETNLFPVINESFPATFIVDGNYHTFTKQGKAFAEVLKEKNVDVTAKFYEDGVVPHVFNFMMDTDEAQDAFNLVKEFLHAHTD